MKELASISAGHFKEISEQLVDKANKRQDAMKQSQGRKTVSY